MLTHLAVHAPGASGAHTGERPRDAITGLAAPTHFGRPDFDALLRRVRDGVETGSYLPGRESSLRTTVGGASPLASRACATGRVLTEGVGGARSVLLRAERARQGAQGQDEARWEQGRPLHVPQGALCESRMPSLEGTRVLTGVYSLAVSGARARPPSLALSRPTLPFAFLTVVAPSFCYFACW